MIYIKILGTLLFLILSGCESKGHRYMKAQDAARTQRTKAYLYEEGILDSPAHPEPTGTHGRRKEVSHVR